MTSTLIEQLVLGAIQGIAEWLPISSEGMILLAKTALFKHTEPMETMIGQALFLHAGSAIAAIIYFRKDILRLFRGMIKPSDQNLSDRKLVHFLIIVTIISCILGFVILKNLTAVLDSSHVPSRAILIVIGACLLITGALQLIKKNIGTLSAHNLNLKDSILLGIVQAFAVLPGLSRSGLTVSALLLRKYDPQSAIRVSFLMSIPIVLIGNIVLNLAGQTTFQIEHLAGLASSFLFSILTIHVLVKAAQKINFGIFVLLIGILVMIAGFLPAA